jgi:hypothetical protein
MDDDLSPYLNYNYGNSDGIRASQLKNQMSISQPDPMQSSMSTGAASLAMGMNPATAGIMVGGQFLSQYLAQKAADERHKRELLSQAAVQHGQGEQHAIDSMMSAYKSALL